MKIEMNNFFSQTGIPEIDFFLQNMSVENMPQQIQSFAQKTLQTYKNADRNTSDSISISGDVYIGSGVEIGDFSVIKGPAIIYDNAIIGEHSLVRNGSVIGKNSIIGHNCEINNSMILNDTTIAHCNVVSYSLIGNNVNFSAFAVAASYLLKNEKIREQTIPITLYDKEFKAYSANCNKYGAIVGDNSRIGALTVLNPGVIMEQNCVVYPLISIQPTYYHMNSHIFKESYFEQFFIQLGQREEKQKKDTAIKAERLDD